MAAKQVIALIILAVLGCTLAAVANLFVGEMVYSISSPTELTVVKGDAPVFFDVTYSYVSGQKRYLHTFGNFLNEAAPPCAGVNGQGGIPPFTSEKWSLACFGKPGDYLYYVQGSTDDRANGNWRYTAIIVHVRDTSLSNIVTPMVGGLLLVPVGNMYLALVADQLELRSPKGADRKL